MSIFFFYVDLLCIFFHDVHIDLPFYAGVYSKFSDTLEAYGSNQTAQIATTYSNDGKNKGLR